MSKLQAINKNVLLDVTPETGEKKTMSGIIIPDTAVERQNSAKIVSMSTIENAEVAVGDTVLYKQYGGTETEFEGKTYLILPYEDILAKVVMIDEV